MDLTSVRIFIIFLNKLSCKSITSILTKNPYSLKPRINSLKLFKKKVYFIEKKLPERAKLLQNIAIKHVVNIGDIWFMN
jgi:hypothetical protein